MTMTSGDYLEDGPVAIFRNSSFLYNIAGVYHAGVVHTAEYAFLLVEGDGNVFRDNVASESGGVFSGKEDSMIVVEGGRFIDNKAEKVRRWGGCEVPGRRVPWLLVAVPSQQKVNSKGKPLRKRHCSTGRHRATKREAR